MKICVSGAAGFVGSELLRTLGAGGDDVFALVRRKPTNCGASPFMHYVDCDLADTLNPIERLGSVDALVHLAGRAHVLRDNSTDFLAEFRRVNVEATECLARAAAAAGAKRFVFVSSIGVHGFALGDLEPVVETSGLGSVEPYAQSKLEAEERLRAVADETGLEMVIVRPALVVGPGAPGNLARLRSLVARAMPIPVPSRANQRSFVTLNNLVDLLIRCVEHPAAAGQVFVAAEPERPSTRQVLEWIAEGMGRRVTTVRCPAAVLRAGATAVGKRDLYEKVFGDLRVDASKARDLLGWSSGESLETAFRALGRGHA